MSVIADFCDVNQRRRCSILSDVTVLFKSCCLSVCLSLCLSLSLSLIDFLTFSLLLFFIAIFSFPLQSLSRFICVIIIIDAVFVYSLLS